MFYRMKVLRIDVLAVTLAMWVAILLFTEAPEVAAGDSGNPQTEKRFNHALSGANTADRFVSVLAKDATGASLKISDAKVREADSEIVPATFIVSLTKPLDYVAWFSYRTLDQTATSVGPDRDYQPVSGDGSIPIGQTAARVTVNVLGDALQESDETFALELTSSDAKIRDRRGICTIKDNDRPRPTSLRLVGNTPDCRVGDTEDLTIALSDESGQPLPGFVVEWRLLEGTSRFLPDTSRERRSITDATGTTGVTVTCPAAGESRIEARVAGVEVQEFTLTVDDVVPPEIDLDPVARAVGDALNVICLRSDLGPDLRAICQAAARLPEDRLNGALRDLAAEEASALGTISAGVLQLQLRNIGARLADLHAFTVAAERYDASRNGFFVSGNLGTGDQQATVQEPGFDLDTRVIIAGADYRLWPAKPPGDSLYVGAALGHSATATDLAADAGGLDTRGTSLSVYTTYVEANRKYHLDGIVTLGRGEIDSERRISFPGFSLQVARATSATEHLAASLGGGWRRKKGDFKVLGLGRVDYLETVVDGYAERGAPGFNLVLDEQEVRSLRAIAGAQLSYNWKLRGQGSLEPLIRLDALHEFEDDSRPILARFVDDPGATSFVIDTNAPDRNYLQLRLGLSADLKNGRHAYLFYTEDLERQDLSFSSVSLGLRYEFDLW